MPRTFATVRELIYWEYAKLISEKAVGDRLNYKFANFTFRKLVQGKAAPSSILTENQQLFSLGDVCAYCGATGSCIGNTLFRYLLGDRTASTTWFARVLHATLKRALATRTSGI